MGCNCWRLAADSKLKEIEEKNGNLFGAFLVNSDCLQPNDQRAVSHFVFVFLTIAVHLCLHSLQDCICAHYFLAQLLPHQTVSVCFVPILAAPPPSTHLPIAKHLIYSPPALESK